MDFIAQKGWKINFTYHLGSDGTTHPPCNSYLQDSNKKAPTTPCQDERPDGIRAGSSNDGILLEDEDGMDIMASEVCMKV